jgi:hypothetical protein
MFGRDTVRFVTLAETGTANSLGVKPKLPTNVDVEGCRHRPLKASETPENLGLDTGTQVWKTTAPPAAAAIAARSTGRMIVDGVTYNIIGGAMPFKDHTGRVFKVTILSTRV